MKRKYKKRNETYCCVIKSRFKKFMDTVKLTDDENLIKLQVENFVNSNQDLIGVIRKQLLNTDKDFRTGWETYGYGSYKGILYNLYYISDRFNSGFRLRWLLELLVNFDKIKGLLK